MTDRRAATPSADSRWSHSRTAGSLQDSDSCALRTLAPRMHVPALLPRNGRGRCRYHAAADSSCRAHRRMSENRYPDALKKEGRNLSQLAAAGKLVLPAYREQEIAAVLGALKRG